MATGANLREKSREVFDDDQYVIAATKLKSGIQHFF
jgi:hypothetical protein